MNRDTNPDERLRRILEDGPLCREILDAMGASRDPGWLESTGGDGEASRRLGQLLESMEEPGRYAALEAIIKAQGRPMLFIQDGTYAWPRGTPCRVWNDSLTRCNTSRLQDAIAGTGRLDLLRWREWYDGTAWLVAPNVAVTNAHVAEALRPGSHCLDFRREHRRNQVDSFPVEEVLWSSSEYDVAFLRIGDDGRRLPRPIDLSRETCHEDMKVAVIGYPGPDQRRHPEELAPVFDGTQGVKRLMPGEVMRIREDGILYHDSSTLMGCSGSVLLGLDSGKAVGLHFAGAPGVANLAVPATVLADMLEALPQ